MGKFSGDAGTSEKDVPAPPRDFVHLANKVYPYQAVTLPSIKTHFRCYGDHGHATVFAFCAASTPVTQGVVAFPEIVTVQFVPVTV